MLDFISIVSYIITRNKTKINNWSKLEQIRANKSKLEPSVPVGKAAKMLGISRWTLIRHAKEWGLKFVWDRRGRRVPISWLKERLGGM